MTTINIWPHGFVYKLNDVTRVHRSKRPLIGPRGLSRHDRIIRYFLRLLSPTHRCRAPSKRTTHQHIIVIGNISCSKIQFDTLLYYLHDTRLTSCLQIGCFPHLCQPRPLQLFALPDTIRLSSEIDNTSRLKKGGGQKMNI